VVDVGANVGYSVVYFARLFPQAKIIAIEPNPINLKALTRNVELNALQNRVIVLKVAAGTSDGTIYLVDRGAASFTTADVELSGVKVSVADIFKQLAAERIDVLKIDCEGAEYPIIMDDRFAALEAATLLLEWHATEEHPAANREIHDRLWRTGLEGGRGRSILGSGHTRRPDWVRPVLRLSTNVTWPLP
jgi:FkbM family methyltransferase